VNDAECKGLVRYSEKNETAMASDMVLDSEITCETTYDGWHGEYTDNEWKVVTLPFVLSRTY
jgi:hypothetical protein